MSFGKAPSSNRMNNKTFIEFGSDRIYTDLDQSNVANQTRLEGEVTKLMISALGSGSGCLGSSPGRCHKVYQVYLHPANNMLLTTGFLYCLHFEFVIPVPQNLDGGDP